MILFLAMFDTVRFCHNFHVQYSFPIFLSIFEMLCHSIPDFVLMFCSYDTISIFDALWFSHFPHLTLYGSVTFHI